MGAALTTKTTAQTITNVTQTNAMEKSFKFQRGKSKLLELFMDCLFMNLIYVHSLGSIPT